MQVIQATFGTFHHFHLARELKSRGYLKHIFSTYPWRRLQREEIPRDLVTTFPWIHTSHIIASRFIRSQSFDGALQKLTASSFDAWLCRQISPCDAYIALSGSGLKSGKRAREMGAKYVCDRGSSHVRYQEQIMLEEYRRWNLDMPWSQSIIARHEKEYENADAITVLSEFARRSFIECGVPPGKLHLMMLGVELKMFRPTAEPPSDSFEVLFAGAVSFRKGIPYLIEAFKKLRHPRKRLRIVGHVTPEIRPYLQTQELSCIEIMGSQPQAELVNLMSRSHVLVLPSIEDGFGMVITQAMACSCPVISTTNTGGPDLYKDGQEGFIVPIRSPEAILSALQQLVDDPSLRQRMSEASLRKVQSVDGWHQYGENYSHFLKKLCGYA